MSTKLSTQRRKVAKMLMERVAVYGCAIRKSDGTYFLGHSLCAAPNVFWKRRDAVKQKKELIEHGFKARVVPVIMTFKFLVPLRTPRLCVSALKSS